ncbi:MAG: radical SAM family heme chaperone HemW [Dehalococcoidia bacterium]|nr:radical SAM family heme chaperone HemW [Dehalococcoidia bacterium]
MAGLYVHVPFCVSKCAYCDFYSVCGRLDLLSPYVDAVHAEARVWAGMSFETLYIGGGTPSLLGVAGLQRLVRGLRDVFDLSSLTEATIEVNPESASEESLRVAMDLGFSRVSIGAQSLSDHELRSVGRVHSARQAADAVHRAVQLGFSGVSADVIVGLPGQTAESVRCTLNGLVGLGVNHLSLYCMSLEEGNPLSVSPPPDLPSDDLQADLFEEGRDILEGWGFIHYEVSNFCRPGRECLHNLNYWRGGEYVGLGPAAASHLGGPRWKNRSDLIAYLDAPSGVREGMEELSPERKMGEEAMLRLRLLVEGVSGEAMEERFGDGGKRLISQLDALAAAGLLAREGSSYRLPRSRVLTSNHVLAQVL